MQPSIGSQGFVASAGEVVRPEVVADGGQVVRVAGDERARADAAVAVAGDAVAVALGVLGRVDEEALLHGREVAAHLEDLLEEGDGALLQVARHLAERPVVVEGRRSSLMPSRAAQVCLTVWTPRMLL